jgi:hypothetical protein
MASSRNSSAIQFLPVTIAWNVEGEPPDAGSLLTSNTDRTRCPSYPQRSMSRELLARTGRPSASSPTKWRRTEKIPSVPDQEPVRAAAWLGSVTAGSTLEAAARRALRAAKDHARGISRSTVPS